MGTTKTALASDIAAMRQFSRFFTRLIGTLEPKHLNTDFSLPEARVLYELSRTETLSAGDLAAHTGIDPGQLSRLLQALQRRRIISRGQAAHDRRQIEIALTAKGRMAFGDLNQRTNEHIAEQLGHLRPQARARVIAAMLTIQHQFNGTMIPQPEIHLRSHGVGDIGWIISRHGALYAEEHGWDIGFEQLVAEIAAQFLKTYDEGRERCWIAEVDGERAGTVMLVRDTDQVAKLRLLIVEPTARGLGLGRMLTAECVRFAREAGYERLTLWTQSILAAARAIYQSAGFRLIHEQPHHSFGHDLVGETWELKLR